jgi:parallel beta-helix repeat protein
MQNMPKHKGSPRNIYLSNLHIHSCSMGLHVLGTTNFTLEDSTLELNGNGARLPSSVRTLRANGAIVTGLCAWAAGNAYFHNAYFLRVVHSLLRNTTFHGSTGHGLKITQQNDTVIENCTVTDNRWQGIWIGQETKGNFGLSIRDTVVLRNHMYVLPTAYCSTSIIKLLDLSAGWGG